MPSYAVLFPADDEGQWESATEAERQATYDVDAQFVELLKARGGQVTGGAELGPSRSTRTLHRTPGPDHDETEPAHPPSGHLSGFLLVSCPDLDDLAAAAVVLTSVHPVVEIRPVVE